MSAFFKRKGQTDKSWYEQRRNRRSYKYDLLYNWIHALIFIALLIFVAAFLDIDKMYKIPMYIVLALLTPDGHSLIRSYSTYLKDLDDDEKMFGGDKNPD